MAQAITTLGILPVNPINNYPYSKGADAAATVNAIDLGSADLWFVQVKLSVKANDNTLTLALFLSEDNAGITNPQYITPVFTIGSAHTGVFILRGMGNSAASRYLNIEVTAGGTVAIDYEVFPARVA